MNQRLVRFFGTMGSVLMATAVGAGALGAHFLKSLLTPEKLFSFETAARYQVYHALALLLVAVFLNVGNLSRSLMKWAGLLFLTGIFLFSGSIYLLALQGSLLVGSWNWLGPVTPLGGLCFLGGWSCLLIAFLRHDQRKGL